jgi:hypothetical protein
MSLEKLSPAERTNPLDESVSQEPVAVLAVELVNAVLGGHAGLVQVPEDILCYLDHRRQALKGWGHETEFKYFDKIGNFWV